MTTWDLTWITVASISGTIVLTWKLYQLNQLVDALRHLTEQYRDTIRALQEQIDWQNGDLQANSRRLVQANNKIAMLNLQNEDLRKTVAVLTDAAEEE
jgi:ABC-type transporter Mla subunit MlaD